ncbi:creatininase family protein [Streptomyces albireticuli]|uniref:creatininase family protein n=1 Tax=Streptomyces albireticuli TaxID=1940 RepID=UPI0036757DFB
MSDTSPPPLPLDTTDDVRDRGHEVAVLPIGSTEQHGPFLPLVTDTVIACTLAGALATTYPLRLLPPLTFSCSHEHEAWPGTVSISARTLGAVVRDIADSLHRSGVGRMVLVNGHGGNYVLRNLVQESAAGGPRMALFPGAADWEAARAAAGLRTSGHSDMHAGELETSILLHAHPRLVRPGHETGDRLHDDRKHLLTLGMAAYTDSGVIGLPSAAAPEKGEALIASLVESFGDYLEVLGSAARRERRRHEREERRP